MRRPVLLTAALVALLLAPAGPATAQAADPGVTLSPGPAAAVDAEVDRLRAQADALSERYFETLGRLAEVQRRIDEIEARLPGLADEVAELRSAARDRAVIAYKRSGNDLASVMGSGDPLEAARRVQWLGRLNARDDALVGELRATSARLAAQRAELRERRDSAAAALDDVRAQGQAIDALLLDAEERRRVASTLPPAAGTAEAAGDATTTTAPSATTTAPRAPTPATPPAAPPTYRPTPGTHPRHDEPFLVCTRTREASGNYAAYNPAGPYLGAYQFLQSTWNSAASHAGRSDLVGVPANTASPYDQDDVAWALYQWRGSAPWGGMCDPQ
jgi:peptidoglycan hydrolase CwlO-like protein